MDTERQDVIKLYLILHLVFLIMEILIAFKYNTGYIIQNKVHL